jgi:hypothetical protein
MPGAGGPHQGVFQLLLAFSRRHLLPPEDKVLPLPGPRPPLRQVSGQAQWRLQRTTQASGQKVWPVQAQNLSLEEEDGASGDGSSLRSAPSPAPPPPRLRAARPHKRRASTQGRQEQSPPSALEARVGSVQDPPSPASTLSFQAAVGD